MLSTFCCCCCSILLFDVITIIVIIIIIVYRAVIVHRIHEYLYSYVPLYVCRWLDEWQWVRIFIVITIATNPMLLTKTKACTLIRKRKGFYCYTTILYIFLSFSLGFPSVPFFPLQHCWRWDMVECFSRNSILRESVFDFSVETI